MKVSVLFVCMGNICRSPMAEAVFRDMVDKAGLSEHFVIDSAGMGAWHAGETAHRGTLAVLTNLGIPYEGRARQISSRDLDDFDYILLADRETQSYFRRLEGTREHKAQVDFILGPAQRAGLLKTDEVPDPYYNGKFNEVYDLVHVGCATLLDQIRKTHGF